VQEHVGCNVGSLTKLCHKCVMYGYASSSDDKRYEDN
jgi:hypothetical protein